MALHIRERPSANFDARTRPIDLVVLHYTGMQDAEAALSRLTDPEPKAGKYPGPWQADTIDPEAPLSRVSAHYVLDEAGVAHRVVDEEHRAWHAGVSSWEGEGDVNSRAIGIEIVNGGHDFGLPEFPDAQIEGLIALLRDILQRRKLDPSRVVGHSDIAPERKLDPGEKFPWKRLADAGVSIWPQAAPSSEEAEAIPRLQAGLAAFGYGVQASGVIDAQTKAALAAFQRRFRPARIDGAPDSETAALIAAAALLKR
jgi:N-acetylmuramoyl-L-alanine amidase